MLRRWRFSRSGLQGTTEYGDCASSGASQPRRLWQTPVRMVPIPRATYKCSAGLSPGERRRHPIPLHRGKQVAGSVCKGDCIATSRIPHGIACATRRKIRHPFPSVRGRICRRVGFSGRTVFQGSSTSLPTCCELSMSSCARAACASGRRSAIAGRSRPLSSNCRSCSSSARVPRYIPWMLRWRR